MRVVELFAGVGGFRLGLERAGHKVIWSNEWDKYAADTYDFNFTEDKIDRRSIVDIPAGDIPAHDLIVGGFPCQAFSVAGKRRGFDETRGTLFFDIMRIAKHHRTPYLLLENVKGLLNHDGGRTFEVILRSLDEHGYDAQWQVLNSKNFGVPQNRERVVIVANLRDRPRPQVFPILGAEPAHHQFEQAEQPGAQGIATRHLDRNGKLVSDIASTVQATETPHIMQLTQPGTSAGDRLYDPDGITPTLSALGGGGGAKTGLYAIGTINRGAFKETSDLALTIPASYYKGHDDHGARPMVRVAEATKLGYAEAEVGDSINLQQLNSKTRRGRVGKGIANTIDTTMFQHTIDPQEYRIRRLTPIECERLQAFPDKWTMYGLKPDGKEYAMSDTQRYKQMGNAVTTNVIEAVGRKLPI